jgi:hypothetical protein
MATYDSQTDQLKAVQLVLKEIAQLCAAPHWTSDRRMTIRHKAELADRYVRTQLKQHAPYPEFCKHPERCAGTGRCQSDIVCND